MKLRKVIVLHVKMLDAYLNTEGWTFLSKTAKMIKCGF